ncbi:unnamed protein product [Fusarium graminearum]|uniref:Chromosome 1, complete genome n=1 Tax=Gibberella zeae (strain ATCC MYA-4620 / CBS 123657 / FGSC 9075 / NRRL 31084 / PH-1) TaxID=229533 RepID=I1RZU3_GIBZE|nr:hypothetical protein FGSG_09948 [Fusarium graminearum PH-1]ESU16594.1 hypothetical protein FGSG_09948 [Fusarium graminearum PH-1]EYB26948.1 hypothetical protein FG05_09948 [Fusarium graminearum]CEF75255.1 unnamed protein product [Fusarium graminearum]CZS78536.1 unnamed protein product [Fusarium graminearum]|eukprot:XP_011318856.1 hypothetical protein FGSG_09948 [Fusarium graminearum PH-1]
MCIEKSAAPMFLQRHLMRTIALRETSILLSTCYLASNIRFYNQSMCGHGLFSIGYNCTAHSNRYPALVHVEQRHVIQHLHTDQIANNEFFEWLMGSWLLSAILSHASLLAYRSDKIMNYDYARPFNYN